MPADSYSRMDSSGSSSEGSNSSDGLSTSPASTSHMKTDRQRTDSENSEKQQRFILPGAPGTEPQILTMDEVTGVMKNIENMTLAHEIALNPEFKLKSYEPIENSLERRIKEIMHKAFWDVLKEQLQREPPCYDHAIQLLVDVKDCFKHVLPKKNTKTLQHIYEVLDEQVIRQQAENGVLDFKAHADFVLQIMAKVCAPVRDEKIQKIQEIGLTQMVDVIETFRGILEVLALMKLDMANCLLDSARNAVITNAIEYERQKFKEYLQVYKAGFPATEEWLNRSKLSVTNPTEQNPTTDFIIKNAYMELLEWKKENVLPETLTMDEERFTKLQQRFLKLVTCATTIAVISGIPAVGQNNQFKKDLAKQLEILIENLQDESEIADKMENIWLHVKSVLTNYLTENNQRLLDEQAELTLKNHLQQIAIENSPVRSLLWKRLKAYLWIVLRNKDMPPLPPGYTEFGVELESFSTSFKRITSYNYSVYGDFYLELLTKLN